MAGGAGEAIRTSLVAASSEDGDGGGYIPSAVAMAGEHWNVGFDEVLRIRGFSIIGEVGSNSEMGDDSSMLSRPGR